MGQSLVTNMGKYHHKLEDELKKYLKVQNVSLIVNGHMALELAIQAFGFPAGSEIITTPFTFISTTHAIVRNNLKPVFCDIKLEDGTIDESKLKVLLPKKRWQFYRFMYMDMFVMLKKYRNWLINII